MSEKQSPKVLVAAGLIGSLALAAATTDTLSAFTASITNSKSSVSTSSYAMKETLSTPGPVTCTSASGANGVATCTTIDTYGGGTLNPGDSATTTVRIDNVGTSTPTAFTLKAGSCSQSGTAPATTTASDLCSKLTIKVYAASTATGSPILTSTLDAFGTAAAQSLTPLAPGSGQDFTFVVTLDGAVDNTYQGLTATQPITWQFA